jgi:hypothetical protein
MENEHSKPTPGPVETICEPAECFPECGDPSCPYTHFDMWRVGSETFHTREAAERACAAIASVEARK